MIPHVPVIGGPIDQRDRSISSGRSRDVAGE